MAYPGEISGLGIRRIARSLFVAAALLPAQTESLVIAPFRPADARHAEGCVSLNEPATLAVFHSRRPGGLGGYDLWTVRREGQAWSAPVHAGPGVNSPEQEIDAALSGDGSALYFTRSAYGGATALAALGPIPDKKTGIYVSHWRNGAWGVAEKLPSPVNLAESAQFRPVPSRDGQRLYFGSNRPGGLGGYDIYVSERKGSTWGAPANLGAPLNSPGDEVDAAVAPSGRTIVLARRAHAAEPQRLVISYWRDNAWSLPADMGPRFNTGAGDGCPWLGHDGRTLYVNSAAKSLLPALAADPARAVWSFTYSKGF